MRTRHTLTNIDDTLPPLPVIDLYVALADYIKAQMKEQDGESFKSTKSKIKWVLTWLGETKTASHADLRHDDFLQLEIWLRTAKSSYKGVSEDLREKILRRLRTALRWAKANDRFPYDYSYWVPLANGESANIVHHVPLPQFEAEASHKIAPLQPGETVTLEMMRMWLAMFFVSKSAQGLRPRTLFWYRQMIVPFFEFLDDYPALDPMDPFTLEIYIADRRKTFAPTTLRGTYVSIAAFFNWLVKRRVIRKEDTPTGIVGRPRVPKKRMRYVTMDEFEKVYESIQDDTWMARRDRALFTILFYSGLRASEVCHLLVTDVNRTTKMIHVNDGKGGVDRNVPYAPQLEELLDRYLRIRPSHPNDQYLFLAAVGRFSARGRMAYSGLQTAIRGRLERCGIVDLGLHAFRHGFAMWALNNGMQLSAVSAALGHASITTTESIYSHWIDVGLRSEYNAAFARVTSSERVST